MYLNATANPSEVKDFGWFETNSTGSIVGTRHLLFSGTGITYDQIPTPTGTSIVFTPTRYFGFYYSDVSEPACPDVRIHISLISNAEMPCSHCTDVTEYVVQSQ